MRNFFTGFNSHIRALQLIKAKKLWPTIIGSAILNLFAYIFIGIVAYVYTDRLLSNLYGYFDLDELAETYQILAKIARLSILISLVILYIYLYKYIILLLFSPVLAFISEKVHNKIRNQASTLQIGRLVKDILRGMIMGLILIGLQLVVLITVIILCAALPVLSPLMLFLMIIAESFIFGAGMIDYSNEYAGLSISESLKLFLNNKTIILGNGIGFNLLLLIPLIGPLFAPPIGVVSGAYLSETALQ